ncbi:helix-turn-helix transcriptional regulator [Virgibacillus sp. 179-BFC.A HS]|uniref:Helix-turn-helix transcriptional regulator n=1 Tax=Tigheibacillus jepli TaxID=3035914 RepID=A0ABU5CN57_9BACI|nr:helix-turn-helix transcriptional regulator [Virgibacillus sp. 179-BFC.A HS]MDY0407234.1 helix-turn-helix transcriptional regulator [Virgibacillus sp. 179-BFC.A HS]
MSIGQRIVNLRENKNWSQRELARRVGLNVSVMNRIESGERPIKDHELIKIATVLNVKSDYLLGLADSLSSVDNDEKEFFKAISDPELERWYAGLPKSDEEDLRKLRKMWEIIKNDQN